MFVKHDLSMSRLRGQGYDGASNMRGELNGFKKLVLDVNPYAFYVHCFAHQLQLVVVAVVMGVLAVSDFFGHTNKIVNMVSASCKRKDVLLQKYHDNLVVQLEHGEILSGKEQHQEISLARPDDTLWGSHHKTLIRFYQMWDSVVEVLHGISLDGADADDRGLASGLMINMESFEFVLILHLMLRVLGLTNDLSQALQQKDQNIVCAINMIVSVKSLLQKLRDDGWQPLLISTTNFCAARNIIVPNMDDNILARGYPRRSRKMVTCLHHYKVTIFNEVLDRNIAEMNNHLSETSTRLLKCIACLDPRDSFSNFGHDKLVELANIYSIDFSSQERYLLTDQLNIYIDVMKRSDEFLACDSLSSLALKLVQSRQHLVFPLVYRLIRLALTLLVATASLERVFSAMNIIKMDLRNKMGDDWLNDLMVCFVEREIFAKISDNQIMIHFHALKSRRGHLPPQTRVHYAITS
uniref:HAT C-terminal dimerisation domain-containing protein n=1 Tax=Hordeum vulgare subsp. vulgare TaxID=112509 RepID=A0A8I6XNG5_HORVV